MQKRQKTDPAEAEARYIKSEVNLESEIHSSEATSSDEEVSSASILVPLKRSESLQGISSCEDNYTHSEAGDIDSSESCNSSSSSCKPAKQNKSAATISPGAQELIRKCMGSLMILKGIKTHGLENHDYRKFFMALALKICSDMEEQTLQVYVICSHRHHRSQSASHNDNPCA